MAFLANRLFRALRSPMALRTMCRVRKEDEVVTTAELATGKQKLELLALQAGEEDPFDYKPLKRGPNSKNDPIMIRSHGTDSRLVGCVCSDESCHINWFWLYEGEPMRCYCGHWFKLNTSKP